MAANLEARAKDLEEKEKELKAREYEVKLEEMRVHTLIKDANFAEYKSGLQKPQALANDSQAPQEGSTIKTSEIFVICILLSLLL